MKLRISLSLVVFDDEHPSLVNIFVSFALFEHRTAFELQGAVMSSASSGLLVYLCVCVCASVFGMLVYVRATARHRAAPV